MLYLQSLAGKIWLKCFFSDAWIKPIWFYQMLRLAVLCSITTLCGTEGQYLTMKSE